MKTTIFIIVMLFFAASGFAQDIIFDWKHLIGNGQRNSGTCIKTDSAGFVYAGGSVLDTINFIDTTINYASQYSHAYITKLSPDGNRVWLKVFCGTCSGITAMTFDNENFLYITGNYWGSIQIGDTMLVSNNTDSTVTENGFIAKFTTDGDLLWARSNSAMYYFWNGCPFHQITADSGNNIILTGLCADEIEYFDTTATINTLDSSWTTYPYPHWEKSQWHVGFIAKYTKDGQKLWVKQIGEVPFSVKCDNNNNILVIGTCTDTITFDTITIAPLGTQSIFLAKFNPDGNALWVQRAGGSDNNNYGVDVAVDNSNNVYITGEMSGNDIYFGNYYAYVFASSDAFLTKFNPSGIYQWVVPVGTSHITYHSVYNRGTSINIRNDTIYLLGQFMDSLNFNGLILKNHGVFDIFLLQLGMNGNIIKAGQYGETGWMYPSEIVLDNYDNIYVAGDYQISGPDYDILIAKIPQGIPVNVVALPDNIHVQLGVFPNPSNGQFFILFINFTGKNYYFEIIDITGSMIYKNNLNKNITEINLADISKGIYLLKVTSDKNTLTRKLIIE